MVHYAVEIDEARNKEKGMRIARFVALLSLSVWSFASLNAQNLIANPGFESGLTSWTVTSAYYWNTAVYSPDSTTRHSGNFSVRGDESNDGSLGALQQNLSGKLVAGRTYVLSGWIKTQNVADGGAIIALAYVDQYGAAPADGGVLAIGFPQGTQDWTFYRSAPFTLKPMPSDAVALVVSLDFSAAHGTAWWDDLTLIQSCNVAQGPCISSPMDGANPQSQFVALSGTGTAGDMLDVLVGGLSVGQVQVDSEGNWEALPYVSLFGSSVTIQVQDQTSSNLSNTITIHPSQAAFLPGPSSPPNSLTALLPLRKADILVTASDTSPQYLLYGPQFTHTALYLGGDANGTPLIAEAVTAKEAGAGIGTCGQVRSLPLDQSLAWTESQTISARRPKTALSGATRTAIAAWAQNITGQCLPYWTDADFGLIPAAYTLYHLYGTGYARFLNQLNTLKTSTTTFICSTLVWHAYYAGTNQTVDLSNPNLMTPQPLSLMSTFSQAFINQLLDPVFVVPETIALSPWLYRVF